MESMREYISTFDVITLEYLYKNFCKSLFLEIEDMQRKILSWRSFMKTHSSDRPRTRPTPNDIRICNYLNSSRNRGWNRKRRLEICWKSRNWFSSKKNIALWGDTNFQRTGFLPSRSHRAKRQFFFLRSLFIVSLMNIVFCLAFCIHSKTYKLSREAEILIKLLWKMWVLLLRKCSRMSSAFCMRSELGFRARGGSRKSTIWEAFPSDLLTWSARDGNLISFKTR